MNYKQLTEKKKVEIDILLKQGLSMRKVAKRLGVKLYKCDPYCSFQRGSNERSNTLVRRYLPKGTSFKITPQIYSDDLD